MMRLSLLLVAGLVATSLSHGLGVRGYPRLECPEGWVLIDRTCFLFGDESGTWHEGQAYCNQRGASLATISSQTQQDAITGMLSHSVWIGLNDLKEEHSYVWADGSEIHYTSWADDEPNNDLGISEQCVEMRKVLGYKWNDNLCDSALKYLCSMPPEEITTTTTTPPPVCEEGWEMFEDTMCYKVSNVLATWPRARDACLAQYAQLAAVTSEGQQNFLAARLKDNTTLGPVYNVWIGLNDRLEEGTFTWQDGTEPGYTNWGYGQPDDYQVYGGEDCAEIVPSTDYKWNDEFCEMELPYVCQKPPSTSCVLPSHT